MYVDDTALVADDADHVADERLKESMQVLAATYDWGLTVNTSQTKVLVVSKDAEAQTANLKLQERDETIEVVHKCKYLGSSFYQ